MADKQPKDRTIRLIVEAYKLFNSDLSVKDIDNYTSLVDDSGFGNAFGEPNKGFETIVYMNKNICWSIEMANPKGEDLNCAVELTAVVHKPDSGNPNFFTKDPLRVDPRTARVCGKIAKNPNLPEKDDSYTIEFNIIYTINGNSGIKAVELDPKLRISTTRG